MSSGYGEQLLFRAGRYRSDSATWHDLAIDEVGTDVWSSTDKPTADEDLEVQGASLRASPSGWCVFYWRPGPDRRFNNANRWVDGDRVLEHARNWVRAFHRFQEVRDGYKGEAVYQENVGELEISISPWRFDGEVRIGGGVYVRTKFPKLGVATDEQLDEVLETLKWALERGPELVEQLNNLKATEPPPIDDPFSRLNHKRGK